MPHLPQLCQVILSLQVTLECAEKCRIPPKAYKFTIPLGTSVNMDGAAIYYPISVLFLATVRGIVLSPVDLIVIVILATLNSLGTTPVPSASLVLIFLIAEQVGVPVGALASILFAIDFLLDRFRTVCNVAGDIYAASAVGILCGMKYSNEEDNVLA